MAALLAFTAGLSAQSTDATILLGQADDALAAGAWYEAVEAYRETLAANPNYTDALVGLAEAYYRLEEYDQAQQFVERALRLARSSTRTLNLAGLVAIGRGDLTEAERAFARVQDIEPNNVDAAIGRAELALARGQSVEAASFLERALRLNPDQRKALLSLVLVYEHLGEPDVARDYLELARSVHRDRPEVHVLAAEYHLRAGDYAAAAQAARTAQAIDPMNHAATTIRAQLALLQESYLEAATIAEELISNDRADVQAWYIRAVARYRSGDLDTALSSARTALRIEPENELVRIWAEWVAMNELPFDDAVRAELARDRSRDGALLERGFRFERAVRAYRRALQLAPLDLALRRDYAELFRRMGFNASYLQELEVLVENGVESVELDRTIEVFRSALGESVAFAWGIDQFTIDRTRTPIALYLSETSSTGYPGSETAVLDFIRRTLQSSEGVSLADSAIVSGYADAFSRARASGSDFFATLRASTTDRLFGITADLLVARTGARAGELRTVRTGPDHAAAAVDAFTADLLETLPLRASIIRREGRRVVIDRGRRDGLETGLVLDVIEPSALTIAPAAARSIYRPDAVIGFSHLFADALL
ncbi:MAG: tetratricopeptide repeat protein, partial [Spirochaetota bacterium]